MTIHLFLKMTYYNETCEKQLLAVCISRKQKQSFTFNNLYTGFAFYITTLNWNEEAHCVVFTQTSAARQVSCDQPKKQLETRGQKRQCVELVWLPALNTFFLQPSNEWQRDKMWEGNKTMAHWEREILMYWNSVYLRKEGSCKCHYLK